MIKSMTGYASESFVINTTKFLVEIKSVNSKNIDLSIRIPEILKSYENDLRKKLTNKLHRGKIEMNVSTGGKFSKEDISFNKEIIKKYIKELKRIDNNEVANYLKIAMGLPNAYESKSAELNNIQTKSLLNKIYSIIAKVDTFRKKEGLETEKDIKDKISKIKSSLNQIKKIKKERITKKRKKLIAELGKIKLEIDNNRFEQEMIYYLEKFDINEEIIRLKSHLILFDESIKSKVPVGKKLGFICQEIGREINTLGSKANDAVLQKHVIDMKENLEKIKENILNIL
tara:strand:- start:4793 stop:5650 length:858 start_codon:yes stop_codon:yes gene_type:complete